MYDEREAYFAEKAVMAKARGKGAPKKKRTAAGMFLSPYTYISLFFSLFFF